VYGDWSHDWMFAAHPVIPASYRLLRRVCTSVNIYIRFGVELWYVLVHTSSGQGVPLTVSVKVWWVSLEGEV
jgi:hypothetical protein